MEALKSWLEQQFEERNVEPNSSLGKRFSTCSIIGRR